MRHTGPQWHYRVTPTAATAPQEASAAGSKRRRKQAPSHGTLACAVLVFFVIKYIRTTTLAQTDESATTENNFEFGHDGFDM